jgi:hypothetical protein
MQRDGIVEGTQEEPSRRSKPATNPNKPALSLFACLLGKLDRARLRLDLLARAAVICNRATPPGVARTGRYFFPKSGPLAKLLAHLTL